MDLIDLGLTIEDIRMMTPDARNRAIRYVREMQRRQRQERLRYFVPQTKRQGNDQKAFLYSLANTRAIFGGNRSGKTEIGVADALYFCLGVHPVRSKHRKPPVYIRYCAPKLKDNVEAVLHKKFKELCPRKDLKGGSWTSAYSVQARTLTFANGSQCKFFSYDQDRDAYGGDDIDAFYMDEHGPYNIYLENVARTVDRNGYAVLTMTPEEGITWEEDEIIEKAENQDGIDYWFFSTLSNPHISEAGKKKLISTINDPRLYDAKIRGRFVALAGMVYPTFDKPVHVVEPFELHPAWHYQFIIDPHHRKASAMIWRAINPDGESFVVKEAEFEPSRGGIEKLAAFIRAQCIGFDRIDDWIIDEAMGGDGMNIFGQPSVAQGLRNEGIPVVSTNISSDKSFSAGIQRVRDKLAIDGVTGRPTHSIFNTCPKTIKQYMKYRYRKETAADEELLREHVRNVDDDFVTCDRYGMMGEPNYVGGNAKVKEQRDNW